MLNRIGRPPALYLPLVLSTALLLGGCNKPAPAAEQGQTQGQAQPADAGAGDCLAGVRSNGLRIITSPDYPPYEFTNEQNEIDGFEIELIKTLAKEISAEPKVTGQSFEGLIPALLAGQADVIAAGMTVNDERKQVVDFTEPFSKERNLILAAGNPDISGEESLKGKTVAVQTGSVQETIASEIEGAEVKHFEVYTDAALALSNGQVDAMIVDEAAGQEFIKQFPALREASQLPEQPKAFVVSKKCPALTDELNKALANLEANGQLNTIKSKWFTQ